MTFPDRLRLPLSFNPARLKADLARLSADAWVSHFVRRNYDGQWNMIPLRGPAGEDHPIRMVHSDPGCTHFVDTPFLARCPYFKQVLAAFPFELHAVRLMGLAPGSQIKTHQDHDLSFEQGAVRLHVPVQTNEKVMFHVNGTPVRMAEGECWYLRLSDPHAVFNGGTSRRVHLVLDAPATPEVGVFLQQQAPPT